jgi:formate dehydrogenase subunit beta
VKEQVRAWLEEDKLDLFLGYMMVDGHPLPHVFTRKNLDELDKLVVSPFRYPLEKIAGDIIAAKPDTRIGIMGRDCSQRTLNVLALANQVDPKHIERFNVNCCPTRKDRPECSSMQPRTPGGFKRAAGINPDAEIEEIQAMPQEERFMKWMYEFQKCIRCYGCRNICPVCYCEECSLESSDLVEKGPLPPEAPLFHLLRAVHMAGRCIDCGLCEEACPADIPLRLLYRKVNSIVKDLFDYDTGVSTTLPPFAVCNLTGQQA